MTGSQVEPPTPHIHIEVASGEVRLEQRRPPVLSSLAGMSVEAALRLVPTLLPVCGQAQEIAARRAVAAALGDGAQPADAGQRLWREQAFAAAWRICIDWADLLGEPRDMQALGAVHRAAEDTGRADALKRLVPGLEELRSLDQLLDWVRAGDSSPARLVKKTLGGGRLLAGVRCVKGVTLSTLARETLGSPAFDPLSPSDNALEVGPLAMARDSLTEALQEQLGATVTARLLAQVLDVRTIWRALLSSGEDEQVEHSWAAGERCGIGCAVTARGPVYHRVSLQDGGSVDQWRVLAPTDWHFSPRGPVQSGLSQLEDPAEMRLLVLAYDPCTAWSLETPGLEA